MTIIVEGSRRVGKSLRMRLIAQIHIARNQQQLDEDAYRHMLETVTGKRSCGGMTIAQLSQVLHRMEQSGWKPKRLRSLSPRSRDRVVDKLRAVWITMAQSGIIQDGSESALGAWVRRQTATANGAGVDQVNWLERDPAMATTVLESLKKWQRRVLAQWKNEDLRIISQHQQLLDQPQADVVAHLLATQRIFYWPLFRELGIQESPQFVLDRRMLRRD